MLPLRPGRPRAFSHRSPGRARARGRRPGMPRRPRPGRPTAFLHRSLGQARARGRRPRIPSPTKVRSLKGCLTGGTTSGAQSEEGLPQPPTVVQGRLVPQSLTQLYAHLIFSTKDREAFLAPSIRSRVHSYLATLIREYDAPFVAVGGVADHVHLLFDMGKLRAPVEFVEHVKKESSKFVKTLGEPYTNFYWQRGYGMFSVSPSLRDEVEAYVRNQEEHHRKKTFQEEYRAFLTRYGIEYDERYVWD